MSKIDKLSITGIRSFSHLQAQSITFFTPLTLIVGYNGSGKTTIIECLKYATTGELPPNSKGGAFIHEPNLCNEREIMAQVKLKYMVAPETTYVVTRSLQLTVKRTNARSQKTLDGSLWSRHHGETNSLSNKDIVLNTKVPETLGVGAAILDAVIFCHQDESLWPMSEPAALKKRFDEIFEALKYTKAIDNIKTIRKQHGEKLTKLKLEEGTNKVNKDKGERCEERMTALSDEIEQLRLQCEETLEQMEEAEQNAKELHEQANNFLRIVNDLQSKTDELRYRRKTLEESKARMEELSESDEQLRDDLAQHQERAARYEQELHTSSSQYQQYKDQLEEYRREMSQKLAEQGRHQSDKAKYERQLGSRVELVRQAAQSHGMRGFDGDLDDQKVRAFYDRIQKLLSDKKREVERLQSENATERESHGAAIAELLGQKQQVTGSRVSAGQKVAACEKRITALRRELSLVEVDEGAKAELDSESKELEHKFQQSSQELQNAAFDEKLQEENDRLQQLESQASRLSRELNESTQLLSDRAQLEVRKTELTQKKRKLSTLTGTWTDKLSTMVDRSWEPSTIEREFQKTLQLKTQAYDEAIRKCDDTNQQLKTIQASLTNAKDRAKKRNAEIERCKSAVLHALQEVDSEKEWTVESLPAEIERVEEQILDLEKGISLWEHLGEFYLACQKVMNKKNRCDLCERPFADVNEKSKLAAKIKSMLEGVKKEEEQGLLADCEELLGQLRTVRPQCETYSRLMSEKADSDQELRAIQEKEENMVRRLEEMDEIVRGKQEERYDLESMSKTVLNIAQTLKDIEEAESQIDRIMSQQQSSGTVRGTQEISDLQDQCAEQRKRVKNQIDKLSGEKQRMRDVVNSLELARSELRNKLSHAIRQLEKKKDFQNQIQSQKDEIHKEKETIQKADADLTAIEPEIAKARAIRDDASERGRARVNKVTDERDALANSVSDLKKIDGDIQEYLDRGGPANLRSSERATQKLEEAIRVIDQDMNDLTVRSNKMKEDQAKGDGKKRNIEDNLTYRKALRDVEELRRDIRQLESRNASEDYDRLEQQAKVHENRRHMLNAERGAMMGSMKTKDDELAHKLKEWNMEYKDAAQKYRETHIKVETTKAAIEDLGRYGAALNNAIMKYHALKMEEVNRIAGDLWQRTYQGTDIDTILIKSDSEATSGRSSYNYRVCMVKQGTEMDMRGRCSAGQKVLASIVIRLALAESFGVGCGLIALDEPTTNLDRDNIRSLAESLHEIIKARRSQSNFQLIVITHDEDFLRHMQCSEFCEEFFRVSRDSNQNSIIKRETISSIVSG
ncbi:Uu.00g027600.m01.CDS01 [Anthostomella pinea]|uniref:DNA repair protein RAD50 n=1 Tax=Anthostomella pinea TaxID=933095 RepID=A0AAI8YCQ5_9PEZI|nr:Uu.00g027600.m01.CDS01 [Anthostomella pinea]